MSQNSNLPEMVSGSLIELARRVKKKDYQGLNLGGENPNSISQHLLIRELAWHLFTARESSYFRVKGTGDPVGDGIAFCAELFAKAAWEEKDRFEKYGLMFCSSSFDSKRENEQSHLWKPAIRGEVITLERSFAELIVSAQHDDLCKDGNVDYMAFIDALDGKISQISVVDYSFGNRRVGSFKGYSGDFSKRSIDSYLKARLRGIEKESKPLAQNIVGCFEDGRVRDVAFFDSYDENVFRGIYCGIVGKAQLGVGRISLPLDYPQQNVALLRLSDLRSNNVKTAEKFLRAYCFVQKE